MFANQSTLFEGERDEIDFLLPCEEDEETTRTRQRRQAETAIDHRYRHEEKSRISVLRWHMAGFAFLVTAVIMILGYVTFVSDDGTNLRPSSSRNLQQIRSLTEESLNVTKAHTSSEEDEDDTEENGRNDMNISEGAVAAITVVGLFGFFFLCIYCSQQQAGQGADAIYPHEADKDDSEKNKHHGNHHGNNRGHKSHHHHHHHHHHGKKDTNSPNHESLSTMATPQDAEDEQKCQEISVPIRGTSIDDNGATDNNYYESISTLGTVEEGRVAR